MTFYNPDVIIVDSPIVNIGSMFFDQLTAKAHAILPIHPKRTIMLKLTVSTNEAALIGGCAVAIYNGRFRFIVTDLNSIVEE